MSGLKFTLVTKDGRTFEGELGTDIKKTLDKRNRAADHEQPQVVYECRSSSGVFVRVWNDELESINGENI